MDKTSDCRSLPGTGPPEVQEIAQKAKRLAGVYNHGELAKGYPGSTVIRKKLLNRSPC